MCRSPHGDLLPCSDVLVATFASATDTNEQSSALDGRIDDDCRSHHPHPRPCRLSRCVLPQEADRECPPRTSPHERRINELSEGGNRVGVVVQQTN